MNHFHGVVWIDHHEAHILKFGLSGVDRTVLHALDKSSHLHHKANSIGSGRVPRDVEFFKRIITDLTGLHAILVVGPSGAKAEFVNYIREKHPPLNKAIVGLETVDHPSERQLLKLAHSYFKIADRIMP